MTAQELCQRLEASTVERLRWKVLREFGVLPCSARAQEMTDVQALIFGAHMLLDLWEDRGEDAHNPGFDSEHFAALKARGRGENLDG